MESLNLKMLGQKSKNQAFSMIELLSAVVIVGVMAVSILNLYSFSRKMNGLLEEGLVVANLLQYKAEEIRSQPFSKNVTVSNQILASFPNYSFTVTQTTNFLGNPYLKRVRIVCVFSSAAGGSRTEQMYLLVANS